MNNWAEIISLILVLVVAFLSLKWNDAKNFLKAVAQLLCVLSMKIEDNTVTKEELQEILKEYQDVVIAAKKLLGLDLP